MKIKEELKDWMWIYRKKLVAGCCILTALGILAAISLTVQARKNQQPVAVQQGIAKEIIRFHVLANSDSDEDQALKMQVKEAVIAQMEPILKDAQDITETRALIKKFLPEIKKMAVKEIEKAGYDYPVSAKLTECYFPMKSYGDCTFPAGRYEALRICIGKAEGKNWWCVLYPNLCFIDSIHAVVPEDQKEELKNVLTEEEYESLFDWKKSDFKIKTRWLEIK